MTKIEYPLFLPPHGLASKIPKDWTAKEAQTYFEWLVQVSENRINDLLIYFGEDAVGSPLDVLSRLGEKVTNTLHANEFSTNHESSNPNLTNKGYALAADMGLLLAKLILSNCPEVTWNIVNKPRNDIDYHKPVLINIGRETLEPIGLSISVALGVLRGTKTYEAWKNVYSYCIKAVSP